MEEAIEAKDKAKFNEVYKHLTITCNQCHITSDHGYIKIQIPEKNPFSNQDFTP